MLLDRICQCSIFCIPPNLIQNHTHYKDAVEIDKYNGPLNQPECLDGVIELD